MADLLVGILDDVTFDVEHLLAQAQATWPEATYYPSDGESANSPAGNLQLEIEQEFLDVAFLASRGGLGVEGDDDLAAVFLAWLTTQPPVCDGTEVVVVNWANDLVPLTPNMTPEQLWALHV